MDGDNNFLSSRNSMAISSSTSPNCEQLVVAFTKLIGEVPGDGRLQSRYSVKDHLGSNSPAIHSQNDIHHQHYVSN